jgi:hypothetical protein
MQETAYSEQSNNFRKKNDIANFSHDLGQECSRLFHKLDFLQLAVNLWFVDLQLAFYTQ